MTFKDLYKKTFAAEAVVPFAKAAEVEQGLSKKYPLEIPAYTFGVEFEFLPAPAERTRDDIIKNLNELFSSRTDVGRKLHNDLEAWVLSEREHREALWSRRGHGDANSFDDTFGPLSPEVFETESPEPQRQDYDTDEDFEEAYNEWQETYSELTSKEKDFFRSGIFDFTDTFISNLASSGDWENYIDESNFYNYDKSIADTILVGKEMGIDIVQDSKFSAEYWTIFQDADNIEVRTPPSLRKELPKVQEFANWVYDQNYSGSSGLHIHIGLPKDFDMFDLLTMATLVDEDAIRKELGPDRNLHFAHLRDKASRDLILLIKQYSNGKNKFTLSERIVSQVIHNLDRYMGTNLKAILKYHTIEFRYLGAINSKNLSAWINYFLILPAVAKSRNKIVIKSGDTKIYAVRDINKNVSFEIIEKPGIRSSLKPFQGSPQQIKKLDKTK